MTWSIVARDSDGAFEVAVASRFFAVGAHCPHARSGVGAVCTQALVNPHYGPKGLDLLAKAVSPPDAVSALTGEDEVSSHRQVHMVDPKGRVAAFTGSACLDRGGHLTRARFSAPGNLLPPTPSIPHTP